MWSKTVISTVLPVLALLGLCTAQGDYRGSDGEPNKVVSLPSDSFFFGAGSASYQIEGAWNVEGKSQNIWDVFTHKPGAVQDNSTGDDACKSYEYWKRDIEMLKYLGVSIYRFSISWSRILPTGFPHEINQQAINYYNELIIELLKNNIRPFVTMYHWDLPQALQDLGGWANPQIAYWFQDYADVLYANFGDKVKIWATINEPAQIVRGYNSKLFAPGLAAGAGIADYLVAKNVIMAHARAYHLHYDKYRPKQKRAIVGISLSTDYYQPLKEAPKDAQAAQDAYEMYVGLYAHPLFSIDGGFPQRIIDLVAAKSKKQGFFRSRLPEFTDEEKKLCRGAADFYGLNHYSTYFVTRQGYRHGQNVPSMDDDLGVVQSFQNEEKTEDEHVVVAPHGIRGALRYIKETYESDPSIFITENGAAQAALNDTQKVDYLKKYINNVCGAIIEDSVKINGYSVWSMMDSFEWSEGYKPKFGLFKVDFDDPKRKRVPRLSAVWYKQLVKNMTLDPYYVPQLENIEF